MTSELFAIKTYQCHGSSFCLYDTLLMDVRAKNMNGH